MTRDERSALVSGRRLLTDMGGDSGMAKRQPGDGAM